MRRPHGSDRSLWIAALACAALGAACSFDTSGIGWLLPDRGVPPAADALAFVADGPLAELPPAPDRGPDAPAPDRGPDGRVPKPINEADLAAAFAAATVPCVRYNGTSPPGQPWIPIVDPEDSGAVEVHFFDGQTLLAGAPEATKSWVSARYTDAALVIFNPNACDAEDPIEGDDEWSCAGLLIRGARVQGPCPGCTITLHSASALDDIDFLDANPDGTYDAELESEDFAAPDDSELLKHRQLAGPINAAKQIILSLGF